MVESLDNKERNNNDSLKQKIISLKFPSTDLINCQLAFSFVLVIITKCSLTIKNLTMNCKKVLAQKTFCFLPTKLEKAIDRV